MVASIFWDNDGIILADYSEAAKTVMGSYYSSLLTKLREKIIEKRSGKVSKGVPVL